MYEGKVNMFAACKTCQSRMYSEQQARQSSMRSTSEYHNQLVA